MPHTSCAALLLLGDNTYTCVVYTWCMSRTNIDIDDAMVAAVMQRFNLDSKKSAVELALRRLLDATDQQAVLERTFGAGWEGNLDELRRDRALS